MCDEIEPAAMAAALRAWYLAHGRDLPWRVGPAARASGEHPDPYRVWLSEVMLQQTTVAAVRERFLRFTARWPKVQALAAAEDADVMAEWAGLGYYARARNLLKCARAVAGPLEGQFPADRAALQALPGIGPYTAAAIAAIAFDLPETVVDGNVERVMARLFAVETPLPTAKPQLVALAHRLTPEMHPGDHAQAVMDLGATICTPTSPACGICPLTRCCAARASGIAAELPRRAPKTAKPIRLGIAYVARRADGALLLETRAPRGLLGGMLGWPGSDWSEAPAPAPPVAADWRALEAEVRHTFTHFHLRLQVQIADVAAATDPVQGHFVPARAFRPEDLPTVMRKVWALASSAFDRANPDPR
ncbi:A/G-specific adenine glycosylase [Tropicimonas sp. IMCC34043]|uniref:A/G-specific adenine glycosylase n=1 Tax=Tropicimonas sp. IMCC34043 TaxID=2248760 RepID=UPI000E22280B|nr:A/G-specific adenine glycosylase [Tropicimonas sp. IMCC34043]